MNRNQLDLHAVFCAAIELNSADEVSHFLDEACEGNTTFRAEVEDLLAHHDDNGDFLGGIAGKDRARTNHAPGTAIGPYQLCERIGEGGMGIVYVAQQTEPVRRKVALKVIRSETAGKDVERRFEAERQTLALMEHPHIARVFDGGMTDFGQPYFVMELVQGLSLIEFCDQHRLSIRERLRVFLQVCRAVEHAHQKGIIHRDLKPSNVLVEEIDGAPVPKVIDFGVAKAVRDELAVQTVFTNITQIVGTPLYMSPEQASMGAVDVDTRSDVYSLGVLLYELLTGATPFDSATLKQAGFDEMRRIIREDEPSRPSTMVGSLKAQMLSTVATCRGTDARQLKTSLRGELDWLVLKALEKDRDRRYGSAMALAEDIERFLDDQPISARPTSNAYRFKKFVQRNRARLIPASVVASVLLVGLTMALVAVVRERTEKQTAWSELESLQDETVRRLYASQMVQAVKAWEDRDYGALEDLLKRTTPETSASPDLRDWEWHFLNEQLRRPFATIPSGRAYAGAWHPQKNEIAVIVRRSTSDAAIEIWKPEEPLPVRVVAEIPGTPASAIVGFDWSANGNRIAFGTVQGRAVVLEAESGNVLFDQQVHVGDHATTFGVSLSPTEDVLATASWFGQIKLWDINTTRLARVIFDPDAKSSVRCVAFSPNGEYLAATLRYGRRAVWNLITNDAPFDYNRVADGSWGQLKWSADGQRFVAVDGDNVAVYAMGKNEPIAVFQHRDVNSVCWISDGLLASCGLDQTMRIWDLQKKQLTQSLRVAQAPLWEVDASSDGQFLSLGHLLGVSVIRLANKLGYDVLQPAESQGGVRSIVRWSRNGQRIAVKHWSQGERDAGARKASLLIYDLRTSQLETVHKGIGLGPMVLWSRDDTHILGVDNLGCRYRLGVDDPSLRTNNDDVKRLFPEFSQLSLNQELGLLAVAAGSEILICDPNRLQAVEHLQLPDQFWGLNLGWSPDNQSLLIVYVVNRNVHIQLYNVHRRQTRELPPVVDRNTPVLAWDPTSTRVAIGVQEAEIHVRSLTAVDDRTTLVGHRAPIQEISWSPNGTRIASCANDGTIRIWDAASGNQLAVFDLTGDSKLCHSVQWSPDGRRLAAGADGGHVIVLDAGSSMPTHNSSGAAIQTANVMMESPASNSSSTESRMQTE